jgi:alkylhydroperoxidase/carboxymuconolactone decarboxylase family protein YurZ/MFS family permease
MNMSEHHKSRASDTSAGQAGWAPLLPIMGAVFVAFLVIGMALPVLPLHVHERLGLGTFVVGLVAGSQFAAAILSRVWAGRQSDARGPKIAMMAGLAIAAASGGLYFLSLTAASRPALSVTILLLGRLLLGVGESFIIIAGQSWALAILTVRNTSKAIAWVGSAMFAAFAIGAPIGSAIYARFGFSGLALTTAALPLLTLLCVARLRGVAPIPRQQAGFMKVMASVWIPGSGAALSSIGFGAITAFSALLFVARGWAAWPAFTAFAAVFIVARLFLGHLADRLAAARVALLSVFVEAAGLALLAVSPSLVVALAGAALTGFGYSLVYPALGVEAVRLVSPQNRGLAMGAYTAFLDVALGFGTPALGFLAQRAGLGSVFVASTIAAFGAAGIAGFLLTKSRGPCAKSGRQRQSGDGVLKRRKHMRLVAAILTGLTVISSSVQAKEERTVGRSQGLDRAAIQAVAPAFDQFTQQRLLGEVWKRPGLDARDRSIITVAALIARNQTIELPFYLDLALESGVKPSEISEIITHLAFYSGWPNATAAVAAAKNVFAGRKISAAQLPPATGPRLPLDEAAEAERATRVNQQFGTAFPGVVQYTTDLLFRDLWLRPNLAPRDRSFVTVSALIASGQVAQIPYHLNRAMDNGLTEPQAGEVIAHLAFYVGWPNAFSAMPVAKEVFEKRLRSAQ